jgi:hypothetical protein
MAKPLPTPSKALLLPLLLLGVTSAALGEASYSYRTLGGCGAYKKYVTETKGKRCWAIFVERAKDGGCNWAESFVEMYPCALNRRIRTGEAVAYTPPPGAFVATLGLARARVERSRSLLYASGGYGSFGWGPAGGPVYCETPGYICMGTDNKNLVFPPTAPAFTSNEASGSYRKVQVETGEQYFDLEAGALVAENFRATLRIKPDDRVNEFSAFYISLAKSTDNLQDSLLRNDEAYYRDNVLVQSRALLRDGQLTIDGALKEARVEVHDSAGVQIATLTMPKVLLAVPRDLEMVDFTLTAGADVGTLDNGIAPRYLPEDHPVSYGVSARTAPEVLEFSNYPNPAASGPVTVDAMVSQTERVSIALYDQNNQLRVPVYSGELRGHARRSFPLNLSRLEPGIYYLRLTRSQGVLTRRVVVK